MPKKRRKKIKDRMELFKSLIRVVITRRVHSLTLERILYDQNQNINKLLLETMWISINFWGTTKVLLPKILYYFGKIWSSKAKLMTLSSVSKVNNLKEIESYRRRRKKYWRKLPKKSKTPAIHILKRNPKSFDYFRF